MRFGGPEGMMLYAPDAGMMRERIEPLIRRLPRT
jgi:hypothetical protein